MASLESRMVIRTLENVMSAMTAAILLMRYLDRDEDALELMRMRDAWRQASRKCIERKALADVARVEAAQ